MNERMGPARQAEEWLRVAESALGLGFWTWSVAEGRLQCSAGFAGLVGINPAGVQPDPVFVESLVHPKDRLAIDDANALLTDERQAERRYRVIRPDGQLRWLQSCATTLFDRSGMPTRVVAVVLDVTDEQSTRRQLANQRALLLTLSELLGAAFWIADGEGRLIDRFNANDEIDITPSHGAVPWKTIVHPEDVARAPAAWREAVTTGKPYRFHGRVMMNDGQYRPLHAIGLPFSPEYSTDLYWGGISAADTRRLTASAALDETQTMLLTPAQVRACRALLDWTADTLATAAGISVSTVRRLESSETQGHGDSMRLVMLAFREAGLRLWLEDDRFCVSG